ncbi:hypothetical protein ACTHQ4_02295 [Alkalicoccobacillus gibsonii]|uniref:hypothetical protein n=1 Tax=Alkalicoccobacillus gibsonii TaxID=79881 RepID=UPI003F7CA568
MQAVCNKGCYKTFHVKFMTDQHDEGIEETYFTCPHCQHRYTSFFTDPEVRRLQELIQFIQDKPKRSQADNQDVLSMQREINARMKILKETMVLHG